MSWRQEWRALAARIDGLVAAGELFFRSLPHVGSDYYGVSNAYAIPAGRAIREDLSRFLESYYGALPIRARETLKRFLESERATGPGSSGGIAGVQGILIPLAVFRAEFGHAIEDAPAHARSLVTRAFLHLQRAIVADPHVRDVWQKGFEEGEPSLERLGGTHLLTFGLWAFKASASGERTDLVLGGRLAVSAEIESAAEALVLTEWKRVLEEAEIDAKINEGVAQARAYSEGILAGFELANDRYIILISKPRLPGIPRTEIDGGISYHVINVAVMPAAPSEEVRREARRSELTKAKEQRNG